MHRQYLKQFSHRYLKYPYVSVVRLRSSATTIDVQIHHIVEPGVESFSHSNTLSFSLGQLNHIPLDRCFAQMLKLAEESMENNHRV